MLQWRMMSRRCRPKIIFIIDYAICKICFADDIVFCSYLPWNNLPDDSIEVGVRRASNVQIANADVKDRLVVNHEVAITVLDRIVRVQHGVVGFHDGRRNLFIQKVHNLKYAALRKPFEESLKRVRLIFSKRTRIERSSDHNPRILDPIQRILDRTSRILELIAMILDVFSTC